MVNQSGVEITTSRPVFSEHDKVEGRVILDPSCSQNGRLRISFEGVFEYSTVTHDDDDGYPHNPTVTHHRYVFLHSSAVAPLTSTPDTRSTIREAFGVRKRPSAANLNSPASRSCRFSFGFQQGSQARPGESMPISFNSEAFVTSSRGRQSYVEKAEVAYHITASWEASDETEAQAVLEAPILLQPDDEFESLDGSSREPVSWLEMPLESERPIPFQCAVTLPQSFSFSRCSSIPYFVVFTTSPSSPCLAKEISSDATVVVSLVRKVAIEPQLPQSSAPLETPPSRNESDGPPSPGTSRPKLLKRTKTAPATVRPLWTPQEHATVRAKRQLQTEATPTPSCSDTRIIQTQICIGFPKRPRIHEGLRGLQAQHNLPDGLYKGNFHLSKDMPPSIEWPGVSVGYYLDVSVLFGQDEVRTAVPIRVF